jgi:hypothetical protein
MPWALFCLLIWQSSRKAAAISLWILLGVTLSVLQRHYIELELVILEKR